MLGRGVSGVDRELQEGLLDPVLGKREFSRTEPGSAAAKERRLTCPVSSTENVSLEIVSISVILPDDDVLKGGLDWPRRAAQRPRLAINPTHNMADAGPALRPERVLQSEAIMASAWQVPG